MMHQRRAVPGGGWVGWGGFFFKWKYLRIFKCYQEGSNAIREVDASREGASMITKITKEAMRMDCKLCSDKGLILDELL